MKRPRRFSLVARLGPPDEPTAPLVQADSDLYDINFLDGRRHLRFGVGSALKALASLGFRPSERAIDLLLLAALVNAADTRISRSSNAQDGWTREIDLYAPVSAPQVWAEQKARLETLLRFLTGDRWRVFFYSRPDHCRSLATQPTSRAIHPITHVSLLSGGLDSLIGAIDLLAAGRRPLFVGHYWDGQTAKAQAAVLSALTTHYSQQHVNCLRVRLGFDRNSLDTGETESTQRSRSFLFYAIGALAASTFDQSMTVNVPENGLIALNVPLDPLRVGALSTRTAHPHVITGMTQLTHAVGLPVSFSNPYRHMTKGEMVSRCADRAFLRSIVAYSMSCSSPAKMRFQGLSPSHCGRCVACLIRRASLKAGLGMEDPTRYAVEDLRAGTLSTKRAEGRDIRSFQLLANRINRDPRLAKILVHKPGPLVGAPDEVPRYAEVFRRGVLEVAALLQGVTATPRCHK